MKNELKCLNTEFVPFFQMVGSKTDSTIANIKLKTFFLINDFHYFRLNGDFYFCSFNRS